MATNWHWTLLDNVALTNPVDRRNRGQNYGKTAEGWTKKRSHEERTPEAEAYYRAKNAAAEAEAQHDWDTRLHFVFEEASCDIPF